jgi:hypothetical protein
MYIFNITFPQFISTFLGGGGGRKPFPPPAQRGGGGGGSGAFVGSGGGNRQGGQGQVQPASDGVYIHLFGCQKYLLFLKFVRIIFHFRKISSIIYSF